MIRNAVGIVIRRITVTATTKRTTSMFEARMSRIGPPSRAIPPTSPSVSNNKTGMAVKMTFPGSVSRFQLFETTVISNCLACCRTSPGEGAGEQASERSPSYVSEAAEPATNGWAVPRHAALIAYRSFVDAAHDRVKAGHDRHGVGHQLPGHHQADRLEVDERRIVDPQPEGLVGAIADRIRGVLAAWSLDRGVGPSGARAEEPWQLRHDRPVRHVVEALVDDPQALLDLVHPQQVARQAVALGPGRDVELELREDAVRVCPPDVERHARR